MLARIRANLPKNPWAEPTDCPKEQAEVRSILNCNDGSGYRGKEPDGSIKFALDYPRTYRFSTKDRHETTVQEMLDIAQALEVEAPTLRTGWGGRGLDVCGAALMRLKACSYRNAAARKGSLTSLSPQAVKQRLEAQCAPDNVASANREIQQIEQRLGAFLNSPAGQEKAITPHLRAVMWGASEQARIMTTYCPEADAFKQRAADLMSSYRSAESACKSTHSGVQSEECIPALPDNLGY